MGLLDDDWELLAAVARIVDQPVMLPDGQGEGLQEGIPEPQPVLLTANGPLLDDQRGSSLSPGEGTSQPGAYLLPSLSRQILLESPLYQHLDEGQGERTEP